MLDDLVTRHTDDEPRPIVDQEEPQFELPGLRPPDELTPAPAASAMGAAGQLQGPQVTEPTEGRDGSPSVAALAIHVNSLHREIEDLATKVGGLLPSSENTPQSCTT